VTLYDIVVAKDAIREAALRYCQGIDRCDADLVKSSYHPDAYDDHGTFKGNAWEFADHAAKSLQRFAATKHVITNHSITVDTATTASGEIYVTAYHLIDQDGAKSLYTWWGRYLDKYESRDGDWRIVHRTVVHEWTEAKDIPAPMPIPADKFKQGSFDRAL
jgi:ketosteroid isomerase-like protein